VNYDVVIVGAGSAGAVLAARLSQDPHTRVLLVDAGPDHDAAHAPLALSGDSFFDALGEPGRTFDGLNARRTPLGSAEPYARGRGIAGSSAVNAMIGMWGVPDDYDHWERELGCPGWAWTDVQPVFRRLAVALTPTRRDEWGVVDTALVAAAERAGHPLCSDPRIDQLGVGSAWLTRSQGKRVSVNDAYLEPARSRQNLTIRGDATVDQVLVNGARVVGVQLRGGEVIEAATVIVCAGAIHSPAILMRSSIDRPGIGLGLKDHASVPLVLELNEPYRGGLDAATVLRWSSTDGFADLQAMALNRAGGGPNEQHLGIVMAALMSVQSSGQVRLASSDAAVHPHVIFNHLDTEQDRRRLREGVRHLVKLVQSEPFRRISHNVLVDDIGTPISALADDDASFDQWMRDNIGNYVHASSTCRMGPRTDDLAVVDPSCRVHGYQGLLVCDASVFPDLPRANTHLPTVMVAERLSELLTR
jgi:choline dehydrogenase-like flavoprotein